MLCDQIRSVSTMKCDETTKQGRFRRFAGNLSMSTMQTVECELAALLGLSRAMGVARTAHPPMSRAVSSTRLVTPALRKMVFSCAFTVSGALPRS